MYYIGFTKKLYKLFSTSIKAVTWENLNSYQPDNFDAIINLAGENISDKHWTPATKDTILKKLELPTKYRMGTIIGTGLQPISWIHWKDLVNGMIFLLDHPEIIGPVNLVSSEVVSQKQFITILAQILKRPVFLWLPSWFIKIVFGQMGRELLLSGQIISPQVLLQHDFHFKHQSLQSALEYEFSEKVTT